MCSIFKFKDVNDFGTGPFQELATPMPISEEESVVLVDDAGHNVGDYTV